MPVRDHYTSVSQPQDFSFRYDPEDQLNVIFRDGKKAAALEYPQIIVATMCTPTTSDGGLDDEDEPNE